MSSHWPTDLDDDGQAPPNIKVVASGDEHLTRQAMYQVVAAAQLKDRGFDLERFQTPLVGKLIRITLPIVAVTPSKERVVVYTQSEEWTIERIEDLRTWLANLREESDLAVIVASRLAVPEAVAVPQVAQFLHVPYDTLNKPDPTAPAPAATEAALLPCLKESKWPGRGETVCRALWEKASSPYMPWVAIGYDHPHTFEFINTKRLAELRTTEHALEQQALATLRARPAKWRPTTVDVKGEPLTILTCSGDYFAAERILDASFMQQAQQTLKAQVLFVGVPRRGLLMATAGTQDAQMASAFGIAVAGQFSRAETALISPMLFAVKDGVIVGILEEVAEALVPDGEPTGPPGGTAGESDPNEPYVMGIVSKNDRGTEDVHLMVGAEDEDGDRLLKAIEAGFMSLMKKHAARQEFSGHIKIVILANTPPAARKRVPKLFEHLRGIANDLSRGKDTRYRVTLEFQKDTLAPAPDAPVARAPRRAAAPPAVTPPAQSRPAWVVPALCIAAIGVVAAAYFGMTRGKAVSYPDTLLYGDASLSRAAEWDREGTSGAVFVPAGEAMPAASRQLGVIASTTYPTASSLLTWIASQPPGAGVRYHDSAAGNQRCLAGANPMPGGMRTYLALQVCRDGAARAVCIELDQAIDDDVATSCLDKGRCFAELCELYWLDERPHLDRALTDLVNR